MILLDPVIMLMCELVESNMKSVLTTHEFILVFFPLNKFEKRFSTFTQPVYIGH